MHPRAHLQAFDDPLQGHVAFGLQPLRDPNLARITFPPTLHPPSRPSQLVQLFLQNVMATSPLLGFYSTSSAGSGWILWDATGRLYTKSSTD